MSNNIIRGTTPTNTFNVNVDLTGCEVLYVTYKQAGRTIIEKAMSDCTVTETSVTVKLTQAETLRFRSDDGPVSIQIRAGWDNGERVASTKVRTTVDGILKDGEI